MAGAGYLQGNVARVTRSELRDETRIVAASLNETVDDITVLERLSLDGKRVTLINPDGSVLYDSEEPAEEMENHANRPEVADAIETGSGSSERSSSTLGEIMLYEAVRLDNGTVVRLAQEQDGILAILASMALPIVLLAVVLLLVSFVAARRSASSIIAPLLEVDLDHPKRNSEDVYSEMEPMLNRIESQRQELKRQMRVLADNDAHAPRVHGKHHA